MADHLARRLAASLLTALMASLVVFLLIRSVPGDVVGQMLGQSSDPAAAAALREFFGLDQPAWRQYLTWLGQLLRGELGASWAQGQPVSGLIGQALLVTTELGLITLALATLIGVPLGMMAGIYEGRWPDRLIQSFNLIGL